MKATNKPKTHGLKALEVALQASALIMRLVGSVPNAYKTIANQIIRSSSSFALNLSEGSGRFGRDRLHFWRVAYGSGKKTQTALRLLVMAQVVNEKRATKALQLLDRALAMTWRLMNPR